MENQDYKFFINETIQVDLISFIISLITVAILSALIQLFYLKFSTSLSNKHDFSKNFVVLGIATCIEAATNTLHKDGQAWVGLNWKRGSASKISKVSE